jgi:hypothetical protein
VEHEHEYGVEHIACMPARVLRLVNPYLRAWICIFDFFSDSSAQQPVVDFPWFGLALALVLTENEYHHHYSSSVITTIKESHHFVNPEVKVFQLLNLDLVSE